MIQSTWFEVEVNNQKLCKNDTQILFGRVIVKTKVVVFGKTLFTGSVNLQYTIFELATHEDTLELVEAS